jgi:ComF family protein
VFFERGSALCEPCEGKLAVLIQAPACARCAKPVAGDGAPCPWCLGKGLSPFDCVMTLGVYDDPLARLIIEMKYQRRWPLAEILADRLWELPRVRDLLESIDAVIAVPLHLRRHWSRGYNQAALIAARLCRLAKKPRIRPAWRVRDTPHQTQIRSQAKRHANVRGAFKLWNPRAVAGKRILIIDDVSTTGATLQSLARELLRAAPASLSALTAAIADPMHRDFDSV